MSLGASKILKGAIGEEESSGANGEGRDTVKVQLQRMQ